MTFASRVLAYNKALSFSGRIPTEFSVINPFKDNPAVWKPMASFYEQYYNDDKTRKLILGINPGRHGAAVTGIPFTDTKHLSSVCGINVDFAHTHEISSVFVYKMISAFGGPELFYNKFYINSPFPLALIRNKNGKELNCNYYDDPDLQKILTPFMIESLRHHISMGIDTNTVYILGKRNALFIEKINASEKLFDNIVVLDHPRYIQQYKSKEVESYISDYLSKLKAE